MRPISNQREDEHIEERSNETENEGGKGKYLRVINERSAEEDLQESSSEEFSKDKAMSNLSTLACRPSKTRKQERIEQTRKSKETSDSDQARTLDKQLFSSQNNSGTSENEIGCGLKSGVPIEA